MSEEELSRAEEYASRLEQWSNTVRFKRDSEERQDFERVLRALQAKLLFVGGGLGVPGPPGPALERVPPPTEPPANRIITQQNQNNISS